MTNDATVINENERTLATQLFQQLQLFKEIYEVTVSLAAVCASEKLNQQELDLLLLTRQNLINQTADIQKQLQAFLGAEKGDEPPEIRDLLTKMRFVLEKTAQLDDSARKDLTEKRNLFKNEVFRIQVSRQADKAYRAPVKQSEGFFIDSKKN
jgi:hypothetical protein